MIFQSTHLVWGATIHKMSAGRQFDISIHAPRVRCDSRNHCSSVQRMYFNPRTSCEVRPEPTSLNPIAKLFQSTHLVWGATYRFSVRYIALDISIHAPRVRCDKKYPALSDLIYYFNPRTSCEVRLYSIEYLHITLTFQSTHLVWGATFSPSENLSEIAFQSTHLVWGATIALLW